MLTSKLVLAASFVVATTGAYAEVGDLHISDWSTSGSTVTRDQVHAESREATRLDLVSMGNSDAPIATAATKKAPEPRHTTEGPYSEFFGCSHRREQFADQTLRLQTCRQYLIVPGQADDQVEPETFKRLRRAPGSAP